MKGNKTNSVRRRGNDLISGRKFSADELELMLLSLLGDTPTHGYELIKRFDTLSEGYYSPSPGVLYPALARLECQGYLHVEHTGRRKDYHLTQAGQAYSIAHLHRAQQLLAVLKHAAKKMIWMRHASDNLAVAADATGWLPEFVQTRKALHAALLKQSDASHDEQRRVITVLERAIDEILNTPSHAPSSLDKATPPPITEINHEN